MTKESLYMNGRGVMQHTRDLCDQLWYAVPYAVAGWSVAVCGPLLMWAFLIHHFPWEPPPSDLSIASAWVLGTLFFCVGIEVAMKWHRAEKELRIHRLSMEAETKLHGKGWATS